MESSCWLLVCLALAGIAASRKLPRYVQVCAVTDPAYDACILRSIESLRPRLVKGIPRMGIPPLEPFEMTRLEVNRHLDPITASLRLQDVKTFGTSRARIEAFKSDLVGMSMSIVLSMPTVTAEGEYEVQGTLLTAKLGGKGVFKANFTNVWGEVAVFTKLNTVDGVRRLSVSDLKTKIRILGSIDLRLSNRPQDPHNAALTHTVNTFLRQNQQQVFSILYPINDETLEAILTKSVDSILKHLDYDELFPSSQ